MEDEAPRTGAAETVGASVSGETGREEEGESPPRESDVAAEAEVETSESEVWCREREKMSDEAGRLSYSVKSETILLMAEEIATDSRFAEAVDASDKIRGAEVLTA